MAAEGDQAAALASLVGQECREIRMQRKRHQGPIVEAGPAQLTVINLKSQRFNQVQLGSGGGAGAGHIAGVGWNLGLVKNDPGHGGRGG